MTADRDTPTLLEQELREQAAAIERRTDLAAARLGRPGLGSAVSDGPEICAEADIAVALDAAPPAWPVSLVGIVPAHLPGSST